ncbi:MAG: DJ-1 family glyoxalase III [Planctomycetota bacterium]|nr:DJ-1 family glyoxalase III [Planctomycetota bacterium]
MSKRVLVPLAAGFEEMEAVIIVDVLRRAGVEVLLAGLDGPGPVPGSRGITVSAEVDLGAVLAEDFDAVVLPGGLGGTHAMRDDERILQAVRRGFEAGRLTAAVCAAPLVLSRAGLVAGRTVTSHPSVQAELVEAGAQVTARRVVRDGALLTSQGPGTAMEFALAVAADLAGQEAAEEVAAAMCC